MLPFKKRSRAESTLSRNKSMNRSLRNKDKKRRLHDQLHVGIQDKLEREITIRDGTSRLLAACTHEDQLLEASKSLHTSNAKIYTYMAQLQKIKTTEVLSRALDDDIEKSHRNICKGRVSVSDIRIPLMWSDPAQPAVRSKDMGRFAVFCLLSISNEVQDTLLVCTDRTTTDICFQDIIIFEDVGHDFELGIEVLSYPMSDQSISAQTPQKLIHKLNRSIGKKEGKAIRERMMKENAAPNSPIYPQFQKLGSTKLNLSCISDQGRSHDLTEITKNNCALSRSRPYLALYGTVSCRLVAQPKCITDKMLTGFLHVLEMVGSIPSWQYMWCHVQSGKLKCWNNPEHENVKVGSAVFDLIAEDIKVSEIERTRQKRANSFQIRDTYERNIFATDSKQELDMWIRGLRQHKHDCLTWHGACVTSYNNESLHAMDIPSPTPMKLTPTLTSRYTPKFRRTYNSIDLDSPESSNRIRNDDAQTSPDLPKKPWSGLFNGALQTSGTKIVKVKDIQTQRKEDSKPPVPRRPANALVKKKRRERQTTMERLKSHENSHKYSEGFSSDACSDDVFTSENDDYEIITSHEDVVNRRKVASPPQRTSTKKKKKRRAPLPPPIPNVPPVAAKLQPQATTPYTRYNKSLSSASSLDDILEDGMSIRKPHSRGVKVLPITSPRVYGNKLGRCQSWDADEFLQSSGGKPSSVENDYEEIRPRTCSVPLLDVGRTSPKRSPVRRTAYGYEFVPSPLSLGRKPVAAPRRSYLTAVEGNKQDSPSNLPKKTYNDKLPIKYKQPSEHSGSPVQSRVRVDENMDSENARWQDEPVYAKVDKNRKKAAARDLHVGVDAYTKAHRAIITVCKQRMEEEDGRRVKVVEKTRSTRAYAANGKILNH